MRATVSDSAVQRFYRYHALVYDKTRWMILHGRRQAVALLGLQPESRVLEVGCGTGLNFRFLQERLDPQRGALVGLDFSHDMLRQAAKRVERRGWRNVELVQGDAADMRFDQPFDAVFFAYSLTMIPEWRRALESARAQLAPQGRVVVLDFGVFGGWGPLGPVMRTWLRLNHVATQHPYIDGMRAVFGDVSVKPWLGGYNFTAVARRSGS